MSQFYQVVNGPTTTAMSVEELQQLCPNLRVDGGNIQYIINQDDYQHQNHQLIGIDQQTGAAIQLSSYQHHQPLIVENPQQQGVYVLETSGHNVQTPAEVQQQQHQVQPQIQQVQVQPQVQHQPQVQQQQVQQIQVQQPQVQQSQVQQPQVQQQIQVQQPQVQQQIQVQQPQVQQPQVQQQVNPQQVPIQQPVHFQQLHHHHHHQQQQHQAQTYYDNGMTIMEHISSPQNMQVAVENNVVEQSPVQHIVYHANKQPVRYMNRIPQIHEQNQQQPPPPPQPQHIINQVTTRPPNITLANAHKNITVEEWQCIQQEQQQLAAVTTKRNERSGVITLTRQNVDVGSPMMTSVMNQQRPVQRHEFAPRRQYGKSRARAQNALVTNNTVQAIASPTVEHQHNLLQQHDNAISKEEQITNVHPQNTSEEVIHQQQQQTQQPPPPPPPLQQQQQQQQPPQQPQQQQQQSVGGHTQILILLPNGHQQLVNMNVPQGTSITDLLEQVGLHVDGNHLAPTTEPTSIEICTQQVPTNINNAEEAQVVSHQQQQHLQQQLQLQQNPLQHQQLQQVLQVQRTPSPQDVKPQIEEKPQENTVSSSSQSATPMVVPKSENFVIKQEDPPDIKPVIKEEHKLVPGKLAVCHFCGYTSVDFFRCQRCRRKLPEDCKSVSFPEIKKKPVKETIPPEKFFPKNQLKVEGGVDVPKGRGRGRSSKRNKSKLVEEPVCLTLSSDDEESAQSDFDSSMTGEKSLNNGQRLCPDSFCFTATDPEVTSSAMGKEPVIPEEDDAGSDTGENRLTQGVRGGGRELDMEGLLDGSIPGSFTTIQCRTVRIGSYKVVPKERVILSSLGVRISVPAIEEETKSVTLTFDMCEIRKVLIHFGRGMPVLFFYIGTNAAARVRAALNMESKQGPYYDPASQDETQRRITLLPERLHEDSKVTLKNIFGSLSNNILEELNNKEANDILVRASPKEVQNLMKKAIGMSPNKKDEIQTILVYPPPPSKGGIPINTEDYACLGEDQFLNDVIIDFYLKYLTLSVLSEEDQARTHVFSSFFYKRLTTRPVKTVRRSHPIEDDPKLSPAEKRHSRVKSWTKNVNIFEKDFIIIPINEHCHWFLAIICFPGLRGSVRFLDNTPIVIPNVKKTKKPAQKKNQANIEDCAKGTLQIGSTTITPIKPATITLDTCGDDGSDRDEAEADDDEMEQGTSEEEDNGNGSQPETPVDKHQLFSELPQEESITPQKPTSKQKTAKPVREPIKQPCILIFDSLAGASRTRVVATLRDYLRIEYKVKEGKEKEFNKDTIKGSTPKVPQQTNFTDCGVYVLQYVESFFQDPIKDYNLPMKNLVNWFSEELVSKKREEIQKLLLRLLEKNNVDIESLNLPKLVFSSSQSEAEPQDENGYPSGNIDTPMDIQTREETVEGGLEISCTEEDEDDESSAITGESSEVTGDSSQVTGESVCGNNSDISSTKSAGSDKKRLVNYDDSDGEGEGQEQKNTSMNVDPHMPAPPSLPVPLPPVDEGKRNTMAFLKTKRIERHSTRGNDTTPLKRMRMGQTQSSDR